ncbi:MAG: hypothetical protein JW807_06675 [Spirochaetes bacterium]|nr:hypothetical protein [Spirochaetota bacterium]
MRKLTSVSVCLFASFFIITGCSSEKEKWFQTNDPPAPFNLFHLFDNYPSLKAAWDSVPGHMGNVKMAEMMKADIPGTAEFLSILAFLMDRADFPGLDLLDDLKAALALVSDDSERFYGNNQKWSESGTEAYDIHSYYGDGNADVYLSEENGFYGFLDEISRYTGGPKVGVSVIGMTNRIVKYLVDNKDAGDLQEFMDDLREVLTEDVDPADGVPDFQVTLKDLAEFAATPMAIADFPMWIDTPDPLNPGDDTLVENISDMDTHTDSELGNMALGFQKLLSGMITLMNGATIDRDGMYDMINNLSAAVDDVDATERLVWNMSNYFTPNGLYYTTEDNSNTVVDTVNKKYCTDSGQLYSDAQIGETLREVLTASAGLFLRDDRRGSLSWYDSIASEDYPLAGVLKNAKKVYADWETAQIQESIYDMMRFDIFGRDRRVSGSYGTSLLEHLLFVGAVSGNFGFEWKPNTDEVNDNPIMDPYNTVQRENGHGEFIGELTLNDSLFSLECQKDAAAQVGTFEIAFDNSTPKINAPDGRNCVFRSRDSFNEDNKATRQFTFSLNYPAIRFSSGPCAGDYGTGTGGNPSGPAPATDGYIPYTANGNGFKDLSSWTFAHVIRACWEGEGPYYATQGAVSIGADKYRYFRPDGTVYAEVDKSTEPWVYTYPVDSSSSYDAADASSPGNRWNRYKASWSTDHYMIETRQDQGSDLIRYWIPKDSDGDTEADAAPVVGGKDTSSGRTYYEIIQENDHNRECASYEEAIFRNFQWVMNEKKMVLIIPLYIYATIPLLARMESAVYQIIEGNGITGLSLARKYRANGVWAKANTGSTNDSTCTYANTSKVPGDYRITVLATPTRYQMWNYVGSYWYNDDVLKLTVVDSVKVYTNTIGRGTATPGIVAHNIFALSRLAFPRSALITRTFNSRDYEHYLLGSKNVNNNNTTDEGFTTSNTVWKNRNALVPLFIALLAPLREKSTPEVNALAKMLEGLKFLIKPMVYFNYNIGSTNGYDEVAMNCWLPRIMGPRATANDAWPSSEEYEAPHSRALMGDWDVTGFDKEDDSETAWLGGWDAQDYYRPEEIPTLLSVLIDSDISRTRANISQRADGLLAKLLSYGDTCVRPSVTETVVTPEPFTADELAAVDNVCLGLEQMTSGMKTSERARGTEIEERMSNGTCGGTVTALSSVKQLDLPEWMFAKRIRPDDPAKYIDLDLDDLLDKVIGEAPDEGLNQFHDTNANLADGTPDWSDFTNVDDDGALDVLQTLIGQFMAEGSPYRITEYLFDIVEAVLRHNPSEAQVKGLQYNLGKMLAYYGEDSSHVYRWMMQGEDPNFSVLYDLLTTALPRVDDEMELYASANGKTRGEVYRSLMASLENVTRDNGMAAFIMDEISIGHHSSGDLINDLALWLDSDLISGPNTVFFRTMSDLLNDMAGIVSASPSSEELYLIYDNYGFQTN